MKPAQAADIAELIPDGATLMIGGFIGAGTPQRLIDALVRRGRRELLRQVGPVPGLRNFWAACGCMGGFSQGGAIGKVLADWMIEGDPGTAGPADRTRASVSYRATSAGSARRATSPTPTIKSRSMRRYSSLQPGRFSL